VLAALGSRSRSAIARFVFKPREVPTFDTSWEELSWARRRRRLVSFSGHIGHLAEDPARSEEKFLATNSGRMESLSFVAPQALLLELLMLWSARAA